MTAPASRRRLTEDALTANGSLVIKNDKNIFGTIVLELTREKSAMLTWLLERGVRLDSASTYDCVALQQFILFWHMAEHDPNFTIQINYSQPLLFFRQLKTTGSVAEMTAEEVPGNFDFHLLEEGDIRPVLAFGRVPRFLKPPGLAIESATKENLTLKFLDIDNNYDAGWATVVRRWVRSIRCLLSIVRPPLPSTALHYPPLPYTVEIYP